MPDLRRDFTEQPGEIVVRLATEDDLAEFAPKKRTPKHEGQLGWEFPDVPVVSKERKGNAK